MIAACMWKNRKNIKEYCSTCGQNTRVGCVALAGTINKKGEDWRLRKFDGGMGESEYRIFKDGVFFAMFDNRKDADTVMELMTLPHQPQGSVSE